VKNRSDFALAVRIQPAVLYRYETGEQSPRLEDVERWADVLEVAPAWLAYGAVDTEATPTEQDDDVRWAAEQMQLDERGLRHLRQIRALLGPMSRAELLTAVEKIRNPSTR
jgi:transcriptional regulator with XRE-family HTH domain